MSPKITLILPSLNVIDYIDECLQSVINQTIKEIEILCVDACSTDGTYEVLLKYQNLDSRIRIIKSDIKSYGYQMNIALDQAKGDYIGIVETDDKVSHNMYEILYNLAKTNDLDFIKSDFYKFTQNKQKNEDQLYINKLSLDTSLYNKIINPQEKVKECYSLIMNTWTGIYKREFLNKFNIRHNESLGASFQDTSFWFLTFAFAKKIMIIDRPLYKNRRDNPNSSVFNSNKVYAFCDVYDFIYNRLLSNNPEKLKEILAVFQLYRYKHYMSALNRSDDKSCKEFIFRFKDDYIKSKNSNELDLSMFSKSNVETLNLILKNPYNYINNYLKERAGKKYSYNTGIKIMQKQTDIAISVIIPVYNKENYIQDCIVSINKQSLENIEIICIDDGSTDDSIKYINQISKYDNRIVLLKNDTNIGSGPSRNRGIEHAKGKYIAFIDADDFYPSNNVLEVLYKKAEDNNANITGGSFIRFNKGKFDDKFEGEYQKYKFDQEGYIEYSEYQFEYGYHRFIYKTSFIKENQIKFPDYYRFQDPSFMVNAMICAKKFYAIPFTTYAYRKTSEGVNWNNRKIEDLIKGLTDILNLSKQQSFENLHKNAVDRINNDFYKIITSNLNKDNLEILSLLLTFNHAIDINLLQKAGYKIIENKYVIKPLRELFANKNKATFKFDIKNIDCSIIMPNGVRKNFILVDSNTLSNKENFSSLSDSYMRLEAKYQRKCETLWKIKNGTSWKIGRIITFIPRMLLKK